MQVVGAEESNTRPIRLSELEPTPEESDKITQAMRQDGFVCVDDVLTRKQAGVLSDAILGAQAFLREHKKHPKEDKGGAMLSFFYLPEKELLVTSNPRAYRALLSAYRSFESLRNETIPHLTISRPERVAVKKPASKNQLGQHMDVNLFKREAHLPGLRVQAMQVASIPQWKDGQTNGALAVVGRFHRYARLASIAMHPKTGVAGLRFSKDLTRCTLHYFLRLPNLPLDALSLYVRFAEAFCEMPGCTELGELDGKSPPNTKINGATVADIRAHAQATATALGLQTCFPVVPHQPLGPTPLHWQPVQDLKPGSLVLWDSLIPHANTTNDSANGSRVVAYLDLAPLHRPNSMTTPARIQMMKEMSAGGSRGVAAENQGEKLFAESGAWANAAAGRVKNGNTLWAVDGKYSQVRPDNRLLPALYGFDPLTRAPFLWEEYSAMDKEGENEPEEPPAKRQKTAQQ